MSSTGPVVVRRVSAASAAEALRRSRRAGQRYVRLTAGQVRRIERDAARRTAVGGSGVEADQ